MIRFTLYIWLLSTSSPYCWLRFSGTAEMSQIDQHVSHQFHAVVPPLFELKTQQQPLELVFPRESPLYP
jgi:hypothetical protein